MLLLCLVGQLSALGRCVLQVLVELTPLVFRVAECPSLVVKVNFEIIENFQLFIEADQYVLVMI